MSDIDETKIYDGLNAIFRDIFDDDAIALRAQTSAADVDGWDSLNHINIIVATEQKFGVKFTTSEVESLKNVGDFVALIRRRAK